MPFMDDTNDLLQRLRAAAIDGRMRNVGYRQKQLAALHEALQTHRGAVCAAMADDLWSSSREVEAEFLLAMTTIRECYEGLDFEKALCEENLVAEGKDNLTRRIGAGLIVIRPNPHTRLYSILAPIAPAIAGGNCILLELEGQTSTVDAVLIDLLPKFLDHDTFCISRNKISERDLTSCIFVDQIGSKMGTETLMSPSPDHILSSSTARTIAIVDRTANIEVAARAIMRARLSFQGASPYAPDVVVVNEARKKDFLEACLRLASKEFSPQTSSTATESKASQEIRKVVQDMEAQRQVSTFGSSNFLLVDVSERTCPIGKMKISGRFLPVITCSSLTDAVSTHRLGPPLLAGYFFASLQAGKFLSQNLDCHVTCINQIPPSLLFGPAAPMAYPPSLQHRYTTEMFSVSRPQFVQPPSRSLEQVADILEQSSGLSPDQIRLLATKPLAERYQPDGKALGFFEQGFFVGFSVVLSVVLPVIGYASWIGGKKVYQLLRRT